MSESKSRRSPWSWIPSLYFAEGLPYVLVMMLSTSFYKDMGISNSEMAFHTALFYLPWVIKPLWSPFVDLFGKKRGWIVLMQFFISLLGFGLAVVTPMSFFFKASLLFMWGIAFCSATHDIAADGFYILSLDTHQQTLYAWIRSLFYKIATISVLGGLGMLAGQIAEICGKREIGWSISFFPDFIRLPPADFASSG